MIICGSLANHESRSLKRWRRDTMDTILQTTFPISFSYMEIVLRLNFTEIYHLMPFAWWESIRKEAKHLEQATSLIWTNSTSSSLTHTCVIRPRWVQLCQWVKGKKSGAAKQQSITWSNVYPDQWRRVTSQGRSELTINLPSHQRGIVDYFVNEIKNTANKK